VSSKCFQLYYICSDRLLTIVLPSYSFHLFPPLTVTFPKLSVILRPLYIHTYMFIYLNYNHQCAYCSPPDDNMSMESDGGMILTGENRRTRKKTCPSATLSTTNPIWTDPCAKPGLRVDKPATNCLSHGTACRPR
jgi:hypothetical protein